MAWFKRSEPYFMFLSLRLIASRKRLFQQIYRWCRSLGLPWGNGRRYGTSSMWYVQTSLPLFHFCENVAFLFCETILFLMGHMHVYLTGKQDNLVQKCAANGLQPHWVSISDSVRNAAQRWPCRVKEESHCEDWSWKPVCILLSPYTTIKWSLL